MSSRIAYFLSCVMALILLNSCASLPPRGQAFVRDITQTAIQEAVVQGIKGQLNPDAGNVVINNNFPQQTQPEIQQQQMVVPQPQIIIPPYVMKKPDGLYYPAPGYKWADENNKLEKGAIPIHTSLHDDGLVYLDDGYVWVDENDKLGKGVKELPPICLAFNYWVDMNNNGTVDREELSGVKNEFKKGETITLAVLYFNTRGPGNATIEVYDPKSRIVFEYTTYINVDGEMAFIQTTNKSDTTLSEIFFNKGGAGNYKVVWHFNDNYLGSIEFALTE